MQVEPGELESTDAAHFSEALTRKLADATVMRDAPPAGPNPTWILRVTLKSQKRGCAFGCSGEGPEPRTVVLEFGIDLFAPTGEKSCGYTVWTDSGVAFQGGTLVDWKSVTRNALDRAPGKIIDQLAGCWMPVQRSGRP